MKYLRHIMFLILTVLVLSACGGSSSSSSSSSSKPDTSWFEGGNLHRATVKQWKAASYSNRLATSADFVAASQDVDYGNLAEFKTMATKLEKCISTAVSGGDVDGEDAAYMGMYRKVCKWLKLGTGLQSEWQAG